MKKAIIVCMLAIFTVISVAGCACNKAVIDLNYKFDYARVYENGEWNVYEITKWNDYENDAICIWTKDGKMIYSSLNNIILYND